MNQTELSKYAQEWPDESKRELLIICGWSIDNNNRSFNGGVAYVHPVNKYITNLDCAFDVEIKRLNRIVEFIENKTQAIEETKRFVLNLTRWESRFFNGVEYFHDPYNSSKFHLLDQAFDEAIRRIQDNFKSGA